MKPTHYYIDSKGHTVYGTVLGYLHSGLCNFLPICDDMETWMMIPVSTSGVRLIDCNDRGMNNA